MQTIFSSIGKAHDDVKRTWAAMTAREFYDGDMDGDINDAQSLTFDKVVSYPVSITHLMSKAPLGYRRSWHHIRSNKVGVRVVWLVVRGALQIVRTQGSCTISSGSGGVLDSNVAFYAKLICDEDSEHESFQIIVPADLVMTHLPYADGCNDVFTLNSSEGVVVERLLNLLVETGEKLNRKMAQSLAGSLLDAISASIGICHEDVPNRQRLADKRLSDIENYILMNLADPDLCSGKVASNCGISSRYLCYVLKAHKTSFSELLWHNRLLKAQKLLVSPKTREYPINEIAFMSGFKSAAHFSRLFKAAYDCSPREYRATILAGGEVAGAVAINIGSTLENKIERKAA